MAKGCVTGDSHLGLTTDGIDRTQDIMNILENDIIARIVDEKVKYFIHNGDVFHNERPYPDHIAMMIDFMHMLEARKIRSFILAGNHDWDGKNGRTHALAPLKKIPFKYITIVDRIGMYQEPGMNFLFLPHVPKSITLAEFNLEPNDYFENQSKSFYRMMAKESKNYVFSHLNIKGAVSGSEEFMIKGEHENFPEYLKNAKKINLIFNGHIHKTQIITNDRNPIIMPGSIECINMGERLDKKHFCIFDI